MCGMITNRESDTHKYNKMIFFYIFIYRNKNLAQHMKASSSPISSDDFFFEFIRI